MKISDKIQFAKLIGELSVAFGRELNRELMSVYFKHLEHQTLYQVEIAITEIISKDERFPALSRIKTLADTKKKSKPEPRSDAVQIEEVVMSNDLPRSKEEFFDAMKKITTKMEIPS